MSKGPGRGGRAFWWAFPLVVLTFLAFLPVLGNGFVGVWDDDDNFVRNPYFRGLGREQVLWAWSTTLLCVYQPLAWMLLEAQYALWGLEPSGYHLVSLLVHGVNAAVLFALVLALLGRTDAAAGPSDRRPLAIGAALASAWFAVHPLRVEVVAWASCQPYLPSILFAMLSTLAYLRAHAPGRPRRLAWLVLAWVLLAVALLFKAIPVTLPVVFLVLDAYPLRRLGSRATLEKLPFLALGGLMMAVALAAKMQQRGLPPRTGDGPIARVAQAGFGVAFYLVKSAWPSRLTADYALPPRVSPLDAPFLASLLALAALGAVAVLLRRRWPGLLAASIAYLVLLGPNLGLVRISDQAAADRYAYLATIPWVAVLAYVLARLARTRGGRRAIAAGAFVVLVTLVALTWRQCRSWRDAVALLSRVVALSAPHSPRANLNLGKALEDEGRFEEARASYARSARLDPHFHAATNNLGGLMFRQGRYREASAYYAEAVRIDPGFAPGHNNLGLALAARHEYAESLPHFEEALRLQPDYSEAHANYAAVLARLGRKDEAVRHYSEALRLMPSNAVAQRGLLGLLDGRALP